MQIKGKQLRTRIIHNSWHSSTRLEPPVGAAESLQSPARPAAPGNWLLSVPVPQALACAHAWKRNLLCFYSSTFSVLVNEGVHGHTPEKVWMVMLLLMIIIIYHWLQSSSFFIWLVKLWACKIKLYTKSPVWKEVIAATTFIFSTEI